MSKKKTNYQSYILCEKEKDTATLDIIAPVVYSNSFGFNQFDLQKELEGVKYLSLKIEKEQIFDSFIYILLEDLKRYCKFNNIKLIIVSENDNFDGFYEFLSEKKPSKMKKEKTNPINEFFENIGRSTKFILQDLLKFVEFIGELTVRFATITSNFKQVRWTDLPIFLIRVGINSIGICLLIVFLIGIIIGYVGAIQLSRFGVGSFLAALVGIAVTRELSPLMVGIIIAGRTGSAFTAEIGTMKVSEEIDALKSFGFDRHYFLVIPRLVATAISLPILVSICNIAGIIGGYVAGNVVLNLTFREFQVQLLDSTLSYFDVLGGVFKAGIFGVIIGIVGCFKGFQVTGGAESVGKYTTSSVVTSIFLIILVDALFVFLI